MSEVNVYTLKTVRLNLLWSTTYGWPVSPVPEHTAHVMARQTKRSGKVTNATNTEATQINQMLKGHIYMQHLTFFFLGLDIRHLYFTTFFLY